MSLIEKRLSKELQGYTYSVEKKGSLIIVSFQYENNYFTFNLDKGYPFRSPLVSSKNNVIISYKPNHVPMKLLKMYKNKFDRCPCCDTITCPNNWTPSCGLVKIIEEYDKFKEDIIKIQKCRFIDKIKTLPYDMKFYIKMFL